MEIQLRMSNHFKNLIIILCSDVFLTLALGQVQFPTNEMKNQFYLQSRHKEINSNDSWMTSPRISKLTKFLLCIDVFEKLMKIRVSYDSYVTDDGNIDLPEFRLETTAVRSPLNFSDILYFSLNTLHCPLNLIKFKKFSYNYGMDFHLMDSITEYCVYVLYPDNGYFANGTELQQLQAEVCGVFQDVRYNTKELMDEYLAAMPNAVENLEKWTEMSSMDNEKRFILCLSVFEQLTKYHLYSQRYETNGVPDKLPDFKETKGRMNAVTLAGNMSDNYITVLTCPIYHINFVKLKYIMRELPKSKAFFYLSKSINSGCVYKLESVVLEPPTPDILTLNIQAEICNLLGPVRTDSKLLENELLQHFSNFLPKLQVENIPLPVIELPAMVPTHKIKLCENVHKKVYMNKIKEKYRTSNYPNRMLKLHINSAVIPRMRIQGFICPLNSSHISDPPLKTFFIANSINIGCVYYLDSHDRTVVWIKYEVCGVYPPQYLLDIHGNKILLPIA